MPEVTYIGYAALRADALQALLVATDQCAQDYTARAKAAAPIREGTLRASIHVAEPAHITGNGVEAKVATGGEAGAYAAVQEKGRWDSGPLAGVTIRNHPGGGGSHYMRSTLLAMAPIYRGHLQAAARSVF